MKTFVLAREGAIYFLARLLPALLNLPTFYLLTNYLSGAEYGRYSLIFSTVAFLQIIFFSWINQGFYRFYSTHPIEARKQLLSTTIGCFAISLVLSLLIGAAIANTADIPPTGLLFGAAAALLGSLAAIELLSVRRNIEERPFAYAGVQIGRALCALLAGGAAAYWTGSAVAVILCSALAWLFLAFVAGIGNWIASIARTRIDRDLTIQLFRYGWPLTAATALMQAVATLDRAMLAIFRTPLAVGEYSSVFDLAQFSLGTLGSAIGLAFYPRILRAHSGDGDTLPGLLRQNAGIQLAILLPSAVGLAIVGPDLTALLVGPQLSGGAAAVMPWVAIAMFLGVFKAYYFDLAFQLSKWTMGSLIVAAVTLLVTGIANLLLIPSLGAVGAAQASLMGFAMATCVSVLLGRMHAMPMPFPWRDALKIGCATLIMILSTVAIPAQPTIAGLTIRVCVGAMTYFGIMMLVDACGLHRLAVEVRQRLGEKRANG